MNLTYIPKESRSVVLLEYLVASKLEKAKNTYEENMRLPRSPQDTKEIGLIYINDLYIIKNMYSYEVEGLIEGIKEIVITIMNQIELTSNEVNNYIQSNSIL